MTNPIIQLITAFIIGLLLVYYSIPAIVRISKAKKLYDVPNERKVNKTPIPNLGGIALFIGISIGALLANHDTFLPEFRYISAATLILFFTGISDDIIELAARKKFAVQIICATILIVLGDIRFTHLHGIFGFQEINYVFSFLISLLAIVGIINALNLIDGIDGLATAIGIMASVFFGTNFFLTGNLQYSIICAATIGSLSAFFVYNVFGRKNKIFMGDTGSLMLGILLAVFAIKYNQIAINGNEQVRNFSPVFSLAILAVPVFDMIRTFSVRIYQGKSPFSPDNNHIHHQLLKLEFSHLKSTLVIISVNLFIISVLYTCRTLNNHALLILLGSLVVVFSLLPEMILKYKKSLQSSAREYKFRQIFIPFNNYSDSEFIQPDQYAKIVNSKKKRIEIRLKETVE